MTIVRCMLYRATAAVLVGSSLFLSAPDLTAARKPKRRRRSGLSKEDYKANDMLNKGLELLRMKQEDRGVKLITSVPQMFPKSKIRFKAYMALGQHYKKKRNFEMAIKQFSQIKGIEDEEMLAEGIYETGICHYHMSSFDKAFMSLRKVTNEYPWTVYANEAFYYIGLCHFKLGRWSKSVEALEMVGASVPTNVRGNVYAEAGQRFYVKIYDKDLVVLKSSNEKLSVTLTTESGDRENVVLEALGRSGEYYLGSIPTLPGEAKSGDGKLQIIGGDVVKVAYTDQNTESGERNQQLISTAKMVSTASIGFTDGAFREYTKGVFGDNDCFVRIKDLDRDKTNERDTITCKVMTRYVVKKERSLEQEGIDLDDEDDEEIRLRDTVTVQLTETAPHSGIFTGKAMPVVVTDNSRINQGDDELAAMQDDDIVLEYFDNFHIKGDSPRRVTYEAKLLIGAIKDVKIIHREVNSPDLKAKKQLIEAKIFLKLAQIFKDVGLNDNAYEKADEGLDRVEDVIRMSLRSSMDRAIVEEAFSIKWDLLLAKDRLSEAIRVCRSLTQLFPDSTLVDKALLKIGLAKMESDDPRHVNEAVSIFNSVIRLKKSNLKPEAAFRIAQVYEKRAMRHQRPDLSRAMLAYKKCAESYPDSPFAGEALEKIVNFYINNRDYTRAIELMERVFQDYPDASFLDKMLLKWTIAAYRLKDYRTALAKVDQLLTEHPQSRLAPKARKIRDSIAKKVD